MKNSHRLIVLLLSAQLLLMSGCSNENPTPSDGSPTATPSASTSTPTIGSNEAETKCVQAISKFRNGLKKLDASQQDLPIAKVTAALVTQKVPSYTKDLGDLTKTCEGIPVFEKSKTDVAEIAKIFTLMADPLVNKDKEELKKIWVIPLNGGEPSNSGIANTDEINDLARKFIKYADQKFGAISNPSLVSDTDLVGQLKTRIDVLEKEISNLKTEVATLKKPIPSPVQTKPPSTDPKVNTEPKVTQPSLLTNFQNFIGITIFLVFVGVIFYILRDRGLLPDLFDNNSSKKSKSRGSSKRNPLGKGSSTSTMTDNSQSAKGVTRYGQIDLTSKSSGHDHSKWQDGSDGQGEKKRSRGDGADPQENISGSFPVDIKSNQDYLPKQIPQTYENIGSLPLHNLVEAYDDRRFDVIESCEENAFYSATVTSITENRKYSAFPLDLTLAPTYNALFWIVKTVDSGYVLFPNPQIKIDQLRIHAIKYFFSTQGFKDEKYKSWRVDPAFVGFDRNEKWTVIKKGIIEFGY